MEKAAEATGVRYLAEHVGERIKEAMSKKGVTQRELSCFAHNYPGFCGKLTPKMISNRVRGVKEFSASELVIIAKRTGVSVEWLLCGVEGGKEANDRAWDKVEERDAEIERLRKRLFEEAQKKCVAEAQKRDAENGRDRYKALFQQCDKENVQLSAKNGRLREAIVNMALDASRMAGKEG